MRTSLILIAILYFSAGCVSTTLESEQFRPAGSAQPAPATSNASAEPVELTSPDTVAAQAGGVNPTAREQAVQEIRAKAAHTSGQKTQIGELPDTAAPQLTPAEQAQKQQQLKQAAAEASASVSDAEVQSKQESIRRLQNRARSHYDNAIDSIEN